MTQVLFSVYAFPVVCFVTRLKVLGAGAGGVVLEAEVQVFVQALVLVLAQVLVHVLVLGCWCRHRCWCMCGCGCGCCNIEVEALVQVQKTYVFPVVCSLNTKHEISMNELDLHEDYHYDLLAMDGHVSVVDLATYCMSVMLDVGKMIIADDKKSEVLGF